MVLGAVCASPASAGAQEVTLGSPNIDQTLTDFGAGCGLESCLFLQKRLPGAEVRAPFSGEIHTWRVVSPGVHDYQLVLMKKKKHGKFKNVGTSSVQSTPGAGEYEYPVDLSIRKGEFIGLHSDSVQGILNDQAKVFTFAPALEFPDSGKPSFKGADELQFNATMSGPG